MIFLPYHLCFSYYGSNGQQHKLRVILQPTGNKCDIDPSERAVSYQQGKQLALEYGMQFLETSAKDNINVDESFAAIAEEVKVRLVREQQAQQRSQGGMDDSGLHEGITLDSGATTKKKSKVRSKCCDTS